VSTAETEAVRAILPSLQHGRSTRLPAWQRTLTFGTGFGIAIHGDDLEVAIVRARPSGPAQPAFAIIRGFRDRPAAEWGAELTQFMAAAGASGLAATVLLPRNEVIVRSLNLPGVADKDVLNAVDLQIDTLHPWGDVDVVWGWSRASKSSVLVGVARKEAVDAVETLFTEAGIALAGITFSSAAIHASLRIWNVGPASLLCFHESSFPGSSFAESSFPGSNQGRTEVYGESASRPAFSAEYPMVAERAVALARAELRLAGDTPAQQLSHVLPGSGGLEDSALGYAAALAGSSPRNTRFANLLPPARRASHNKVQYLMPSVLGGLLLLALIAVFVVYPAIDRRRYRNELDRAARQLEPSALRAQAMEKKNAAERTRIGMLDDLKRRPQADLDVLNELTRLLPPPAWTAAIEIYPDSVVIAGEADQAAPLLKVLDSSPLFQNSEFLLSVTRNGQMEQFRIKTIRRGRGGRTTP
jgi:Tfp pilus assembly protein PilN